MPNQPPPHTALHAWAHINTTEYIHTHGIPQAFTDYYAGTHHTLAEFITTNTEPTTTPLPDEPTLHHELATHYHIIHTPEEIHLFHKTN